MSSKKLSKKLVDNQIATRNDNFYAWRCLKALGIDADDGVVRISLAHYNSIEETKNLLKYLIKFNLVRVIPLKKHFLNHILHIFSFQKIEFLYPIFLNFV